MAKKKFYGTLVRRIVLVFLLLVILPLLIHTALVWDRDYRQQIDIAFNRLELQAKANERLFGDWMQNGLNLLTTFSFLTDDEENLTRRFDDAKDFGDYSHLFILDGSMGKDCSTGGNVAFPQDMLDRAMRDGKLAFLWKNPATQKKEMVLLKKIEGVLWGLSTDASRFVKNRGIDVSLVTPDTPLKEHTRVLNKQQLKQGPEQFSFSEMVDLHGKTLAVRVNPPNTAFGLETSVGADEIEGVDAEPFLNRMILLFVLLILLGALVAWWLIARLSKPLGELSRVMEEVAGGNLNERYQKKRFGFEVNQLGEQFNTMLGSLTTHMEIAKKERVSRELLARELEIGRDVQDQLLPTEVLDIPGLKVGSGFFPAKEVGGDFYDLFIGKQRDLMISIADASDKGVSACFYSLIVRSLLRGRFLAGGGPEELAKDVNSLFCRDTKETGEFVTAWLGIYDASSRTLSFCNAGHLPALLINHSGELEELTTEGIALGASLEGQYFVQKRVLQKGSKLFLYSDGVTEAENEKGELFGKSRLLSFLQNHHTLEPQELIDRLTKEVEQFSSSSQQRDDFTALCLQMH